MMMMMATAHDADFSAGESRRERPDRRAAPPPTTRLTLPLTRWLPRVLARTRAMPAWQGALLSAAIVAGATALRAALLPVMPVGLPYLFYFVPVLLSSGLFGGAAGVLTTALSALAALVFIVEPSGRDIMPPGPLDGIAVTAFVLVGGCIAWVVEEQHRAVESLSAVVAQLRASEERRLLLIREYNHRSKNDIASLLALMQLRARAARSEEAKLVLGEAVNHARGLATIHETLSAAALRPGELFAEVDSCAFLTNLVREIGTALTGAGLRPVRFVVAAETHALTTEQAVQIGLVVNECSTNALKYGFPGNRPGRVELHFSRQADAYVLTVRDDGIGLPPTASLPPAGPGTGRGLGSRLLRSLAAQLRGSFSRQPGEDGIGTLCTLRFPAEPA